MKNKQIDPCWKSPGSDMLKWAQEWEVSNHKDPKGHGLGDLTQPCKLESGAVCPACGKTGK